MQESLSANGTEKQTDWDAIDWGKANRIVRNLRHRIFRAQHLGNFKKVHSLQKLMMTCYSNRLVSVRRVAQVTLSSTAPRQDRKQDQRLPAAQRPKAASSHNSCTRSA